MHGDFVHLSELAEFQDKARVGVAAVAMMTALAGWHRK
jgi:hypothetical protein